LGSSSLASSSLPNGGLSSVGESLLTTGQAPNAAPSTTTAAAAPAAGTLSTYQAQYLSLQEYDNEELMYASFLSPEAGLANADSVFAQAAILLGSPGSPGTLATGASPTILGSSSTSATTPTSSNTTTPTSSSSTSTSTASGALNNLPSVSSILAASDTEAEQTLNAYSIAPVGSSILDYQA